MKKLLILSMVLINTSILSFSETQEKPETLEITARVIQPVDFEVEPVRFGDVMRGREKDAPQENGKITIVGEPNSNVKIELKYKEEDLDIASNNERVELLKEDDSTAPALVYHPEFVYEEDQTPLSSNQISLPTGSTTISARGKLRTPEEAEIGNYVAEVDVKVYYD